MTSPRRVNFCPQRMPTKRRQRTPEEKAAIVEAIRVAHYDVLRRKAIRGEAEFPEVLPEYRALSHGQSQHPINELVRIRDAAAWCVMNSPDEDSLVLFTATLDAATEKVRRS